MLLPYLWRNSLIVPTTLTNGVMIGDTTPLIDIVVILLVLHKVLLHSFPSPSPSLPLSLQIFHVIVVKKICCCGFHLLTTLRPTQPIRCANN
jgi:hypothetical protein